MPDRLRGMVWALAFFLLCSTPTFISGWRMHGWRDALSPVDPYSEANALREVDGFRAQGITHDAGLGNVLYGPRYPNDGFVSSAEDRAASVLPNGIYTHYPPGPEYLLYAAEKLFGPHPVSRLRLLPLLLCWGPAVFLGFSIRRRFGPTTGWLVMLACVSVAPFNDANTSVHFLGYALALLLVEIGLAIGHNRTVLPFLALGFLQGWLSFDYMFLVICAPLGVAFAMPQIDPSEVPRIRLAVLRCVLAGSGFILAHVIHLMQVWDYYGTLHQAVADLHNSARFRAGAGQSGGVTGYLGRAAILMLYYTISPYPVSFPFWHSAAEFPKAAHAFRFLGLTLGAWFPLVTLALWLAGHVGPHRNSKHLVRRWCKINLIGLAVSSLWWFAMQNHATIHAHLLYRQLFFWFFLSVLFLAVLIAGPGRNQPGGTIR
jgi:hypothetical protein